MTVREYLMSLGATQSWGAEHDFRATFTIYDERTEHSVSFVSNAILEENDVYFDVFFWGLDCFADFGSRYAEVFSCMRVSTIEEVQFIVTHFMK